MPQILNIDALVVDTVTLNLKLPDGTVKAFHLKDDIPVTTGLLAFQLMQKQAAIKEADTGKNSFELQGQLLQMLSDDLAHIVGEIFRHSYPEMSDAEIATLISPANQMAILQIFFTRLTSRFSGPGTNTASSSSQEQSQSQASEPSSEEIPSPSSSNDPDPAA
jgi:hypothetical protein